MLTNHTAKSTRERIMQTLLVRERCTINDLAKVVDINPISVRHHMMKLEADGLIDSDETRHGVGRPRQVYYLTEKGREQFPTRYIRLTMRLLEQLKEKVPQSFIQALFTQMATDLAANYMGDIQELTFDERLDFVGRLLSSEGFNVEIEKQEDQYLLHETSCPYYQIGQTHPEVCVLDKTLISTLLDVPTEKVQCLLQGDSICSYIIQKDFLQSESSTGIAATNSNQFLL
jgi:DeoR family suf operon transcriptional repressor